VNNVKLKIKTYNEAKKNSYLIIAHKKIVLVEVYFNFMKIKKYFIGLFSLTYNYYLN